MYVSSRPLQWWTAGIILLKSRGFNNSSWKPKTLTTDVKELKKIGVRPKLCPVLPTVTDPIRRSGDSRRKTFGSIRHIPPGFPHQEDKFNFEIGLSPFVDCFIDLNYSSIIGNVFYVRKSTVRYVANNFHPDQNWQIMPSWLTGRAVEECSVMCPK